MTEHIPEFRRRRAMWWLVVTGVVIGYPTFLAAQGAAQRPDVPSAQKTVTAPAETIQEYKLQLQQLEQALEKQKAPATRGDYRIGPEDLLEISVFEAPEFNSALRVSAGGEVSMPMLGLLHAAGLTAAEMESVVGERLRGNYLKDPHVGVVVKEVQSHPVSVFGAVKRPGVFQIRSAKTLLEILAMAEGLADDAGDTAIIVRHGGAGILLRTAEERSRADETTDSKEARSASPSTAGDSSQGAPPISASEEVSLKALVESSDASSNVLVYPGDAVKVPRAGVVYVVGEVRKPGGFQLRSNENITVLQVLALAEGLTRTSAKTHARIIRTDEKNGTKEEMPLDLGKILAGKSSDPMLHSKDILFVPGSGSRSALYRGLEAAVSVGTGLAIYRR